MQGQPSLELAYKEQERLNLQRTIHSLSSSSPYHNGTISIEKLHHTGKFYMNQEEIQMIKMGQLKEYLSQFDMDQMDDCRLFG